MHVHALIQYDQLIAGEDFPFINVHSDVILIFFFPTFVNEGFGVLWCAIMRLTYSVLQHI